ncbi:PAS domain-containing protein [Xanthobacter sp. VTT E-85241]|uniref:PAS domain-containing hybrid sensor histidine kinase/response regulator n=1 Tax=Roseixanthobacter finlandensis TaxID=3119922 RepID=UPI00372C6183
MFTNAGVQGTDLAALFNAVPNPYVILTPEFIIVGMNEAYLRVTMRRREDILGLSMFEAFPSDPASASNQMLRASLERVIRNRAREDLPFIPYPIQRPDGVMEMRYWSATHTPLFGPDGSVRHVVQHTVDVTELHNLRVSLGATASSPALLIEGEVFDRAEAVQEANTKLDRERQRLQTLFEQAPAFTAVLRGPDHLVELANAAYLRLVGDRPLVGLTVREAFPELAGQPVLDALDRAYRTGEAFVAHGLSVMLRRAPGLPLEEHVLDFIYQPVVDADGSVGGIFVQGQDITEQRRAEDALREREVELRKLNESLEMQVAERTRERDRLWRLSGDLMGVCREDGVLEAVNGAWSDLLGWSECDLLAHGFLDLVHPEDVAATRAALARSREAPAIPRFENRCRRSDGTYRVLAWTLAADTGRLYIVGRDMTDQRLTEEQLRQSQKMEAVGQLTGGIAHDFNNLLQGITGSLDILRRRVAQGRTAELERFVDNAMSSANRAAALTHRLLAFSRRQPLDPKPLKINPLVLSMEDLLRRTMGESIHLELGLADGLWLTLCDANQLENAILNLVINARDAMPDGGRLTIETCNADLDDSYAARVPGVTAGQYVCLAVSDTGTGMAPDVIARAFDPFFTTKPIGQGTGLGLSMIYGFARQSEGQCHIYSEVGAGTCVKLYLPRYRDGGSDPSGAPGPEARESGGLGAVVLVVEDDRVVRGLILEVLRELGYAAIAAEDGQAGLDLLMSDRRIDLVITDIGLPRLNGRQMVDAARERRRDLKVLFMTGYAENAAVAAGFLEPGMTMVTKPFAVAHLAARIRAMLEQAQV